MEQEISFIVEKEQAHERLDKMISLMSNLSSRAQIQDWIQNERVYVNGKSKKGSYRVKEGDFIRVQVPPVIEYQVEAENVPLDVRYEDQDVLVVNKPRGMVVHPGAGNYSGTLVNALLGHCKEDLSGIGGVCRPGIVHRIDKDTSGLLMVAKNDFAHQSLSEQLKEHTVDRKYLAIVYGVISHNTGTIDAPIARDLIRRQQMAVNKDGKYAITHFFVEKRFVNHTLITCRLETGRTHQIRVHMKYIGFPIIGDPLYGPQKKDYPIKGQALHAQVLGFNHPRTNKRMLFKAEVPQDIEGILLNFEKNS